MTTFSPSPIKTSPLQQFVFGNKEKLSKKYLEINFVIEREQKKKNCLLKYFPKPHNIPMPPLFVNYSLFLEFAEFLRAEKT